MLRIGALLFCLFPYLFLLSKTTGLKAVDSSELIWALANSMKQASISAVLAMLLGFWMALGLNRLDLHPRIWGKSLRLALLLPSLLPPFFVILTFLSWVQPFPFGITGMVLVHFPMMAGFAAILLQSQINQKLGELSQIAQVMGAKRWLFWKRSWGLIRRELFSLAGFMFIWAFTSFSVPLVLGGGRGTTLEILIYEKIRISGDWGSALSLSLIQSVFMAIVLFAIPPTQTGVSKVNVLPSGLLRSRVGLGLGVFLAVLFIAPWILLSWSGWSYIWKSEGVFSHVVSASLASLRLGALAGLIAIFILGLFCAAFDRAWFQKFLRGYFPPSASLLGLCGLGVMAFAVDLDPGYFLLHGGRGLSNFVYTVLLIVLFAPSLFRLGLDSMMADLQEQIEVARILGAGRRRIFMDIILPQVWPRICLLASLAAFWAAGDFALAKFFFETGETLPLMIENLMGSYRIDPALSLGHLVFAIGGLLFFAFWRLGHVFDSRP